MKSFLPLVYRCVCLLVLLMRAVVGFGDTFTVTTNADEGAGSLREAIASANANPGPDVIGFGAVGTIYLTGDLPLIEETLVVDATGSGVVIDGGGLASAFQIVAGEGSIIKGLTIQNCGYLGISANVNDVQIINNTLFNQTVNIMVTGASGAIVRGNQIQGGIYGIVLNACTQSQVGGSAAGQGNQVALGVFGEFLVMYNVFVAGCSDVSVKGNTLGSNSTAADDTYSVYVYESQGIQVGGNAAAEANHILSPYDYAVLLENSNTSTVINNYIGVDEPVQTEVGHAIYLLGSSDNVIGGIAANQANRMAYFVFAPMEAIYIDAASQRNKVSGNTMVHPLQPSHSQYFTKGININATGNGGKANPVLAQITSAGAGLTITGTAQVGDLIEVFGTDPFGRSATYTGTATADNAGGWTFSHPSLREGVYYKATATDEQGNTSEFSNHLQKEAPAASITLNPIPGSPFCPGAPVTVSFSATGTFTGNFVAQLSQVNASTFAANPLQLGAAASGPINGTLPDGLAAGTYQVRVVSGGVISNLTSITVQTTLATLAFVPAGGSSVCRGGATTFSVSGPVAGYTYEWQVTGANTGTGTGTSFSYTFNNAGSTNVVLTARQYGCSASTTQAYSIQAAPTVSVEALAGTSCDQATEGKLRFITNGTSFSLLRNGSPYDGPFALPGTATTITRDNLLPGSYQVVVTNAIGCTAESAAVTIQNGSPVLTTCTNYLRCDGSGSAVLHFKVQYPLPPAGFSGQYAYRVLKNGAEVVKDTLPAPNTGSGDDTYGDPANPWPYTVTIPGADTVSTYTLEVSALVNGPGCNCLVPYCKKETTFSFSRPPITLSVDATEQLNGRRVYYVCGVNAKAPVGVSLSALLNACSEPYQGYRLSLRKEGQAPVVVRDTAGAVSAVQETRTLPLGTGVYTLEAELGAGNYRCSRVITFEIRSMNLTVSVTATPASCQEGATATAVIAGAMSQVNYRWFRTGDGTVSDTLAAGSAQISGLVAGSYRLEISMRGNNAACRQSTDFTIVEEPGIDTVLVRQNGCEALAKAKVPVAGSYRVEWHRYDTVETGAVRDTVLLSTYVSAQDSLIAALPEAYLLDSAYYYARVYNPAGCPVSSADTYLKRPKVERLYALCLQWETPEIKPVVTPPPSVQTGPVIAATNIKEAIEEKVAACVTRQSAVAAASFAAACTTDSTMQDVLTLSYPQHDHHYTLYYYDRAGNLARTVPPAGVVPLTGNAVTRNHHSDHEYVTTYDYNSLQQLVRQYTPDGDSTHFIYNNLGQMRFSQNARQKAENTFSYTKYDYIGRVQEVGQALPKAGTAKPVFSLPSVHAGNDALMQGDKGAPATGRYPAAGDALLSERTVTVYNDPATDVSYFGLSPQRHLLNRVSYTYTYNLADSANGVYTYFSYDPHGKVEWLVQQMPGLGRNYVAYKYDLISGRVLEVKYNEFRADKFFHRYQYDEDNRLTVVQTSRDGHIWESDATYAYYSHGPLRRMGIGEDKVQGVDYAYTIQGWLKGVNGPAGAVDKDLGRDGGSLSEYSPDEFGMALGYFAGDYKHKGSVFDAAGSTANKYNLTPEKELFNGNISAWVSYMKVDPASAGSGSKTEGFQYGYDRLNRLRDSKHRLFTPADSLWHNSTAYRSNYRYDGNGNLLGLQRYDDKGDLLDDLAYSYNSTAARKNNRLEKVSDQAGTSAYQQDVEGENGYVYDQIGNLIQHQADSVRIRWSLYGKVSQVKPVDGAKKPYLRYLYDAAGNRILKEVNTGPADGSQPDKIKTTYYVRDVQGNVLSIYEQTRSQATDTLRICAPPVVLQALATYTPDSSMAAGLAAAGQAFWISDTITVTEGNAADGLVSLSYQQDSVRRMIFYRGLVSGADQASMPNVYVRYNDTTQIRALLPELFADSISVDVSSNAKQLLVADSLRLQVHTGHRYAPKGPDSTGNLTRVRLLLQPPCEEQVRLAFQHGEVPLYGSDRVGQYSSDSLVYRAAGAVPGADTAVAVAASGYAYRETGRKQYELKDHLGNVRVVVGDEKLAEVSIKVRAPGDTLVSLFLRAGVRNQSNYYPFGMTQPGGSYQAQGAEGYRYAYNGKEKDTDFLDNYDYGFRIYQPGIGRFLSVDPLTKEYPWYTPYQFAGNKPINSVDLDGLEEYESYEAYKIHKGGAALKVMDGSDGSWLTSDRESWSPVWQNACATITKNSLQDRFKPFVQVRDYYIWVDRALADKGHETRWTKGALALVDDLADGYQEGALTMGKWFGPGSLVPLLEDLNVGIANYAVTRFNELLYGKYANTPLKGEVAYQFDKNFIENEQGPVALEVYSKSQYKLSALDNINTVFNKKGWLGSAVGFTASSFIPVVPEYNVDLTDPSSNYGQQGRIDIPLLMLYPDRHVPAVPFLKNEMYSKGTLNKSTVSYSMFKFSNSKVMNKRW